MVRGVVCPPPGAWTCAVTVTGSVMMSTVIPARSSLLRLATAVARSLVAFCRAWETFRSKSRLSVSHFFHSASSAASLPCTDCFAWSALTARSIAMELLW